MVRPRSRCYLRNRDLVKLMAETITSRGATHNFKSDWNDLKAVAMLVKHLLVAWMHVNGRRERREVPSEPLGEEQVIPELCAAR